MARLIKRPNESGISVRTRRKADAMGAGDNESFLRDLRLAEKIQHSMIPTTLRVPGMEILIEYKPMGLLGGDYAWVGQSRGDEVHFHLIDVSGHGIAACLLANRLNAEAVNCALKGVGPGDTLACLNTFMLDLGLAHGPDGLRGGSMYFTMFSGVLDLKSGGLTYSSGGHPPALIRGVDGTVRQLERTAPILGVMGAYTRPAQEGEDRLDHGETMIIYSDGLYESFDDKGKEWGLEQLVATLSASKAFPAPTPGDRRSGSATGIPTVGRSHVPEIVLPAELLSPQHQRRLNDSRTAGAEGHPPSQPDPLSASRQLMNELRQAEENHRGDDVQKDDIAIILIHRT
ncbi:MAG TPA: PP2C family protein-serine/threonine phosphatase [Planctomycetota bacterium]|nr:PP2C family protein-serine/threonine phosphatase [Planctomycetota bacterium]